jgi:hypothetical protein
MKWEPSADLDIDVMTFWCPVSGSLSFRHFPVCTKYPHISEQSSQLSQPKKKDTTYFNQNRGFPISKIIANSNTSITGYFNKTEKRRRRQEKYHKQKQEHQTTRMRKGERK